MLQKSTVERKTFELLTKLMQEPLLASTRLVGGTALALQIGHRRSTDLDLFTTDIPDVENIVKTLTEEYKYKPQLITDKSTIGFINDIKIDVIYHPYEWIKPVVGENSIRIASIEDIAAMKLHAITNSGERPKDFVDIAFLSQIFSYNQMKELALSKYPMYDPLMIDRAIIYFDDVNQELIKKIRMINTEMDWSKIKHRIIRMTDHPDNRFKRAPLQLKNKLKRTPHR